MADKPEFNELSDDDLSQASGGAGGGMCTSGGYDTAQKENPNAGPMGWNDQFLFGG